VEFFSFLFVKKNFFDDRKRGGERNERAKKIGKSTGLNILYYQKCKNKK